MKWMNPTDVFPKPAAPKAAVFPKPATVELTEDPNMPELASHERERKQRKLAPAKTRRNSFGNLDELKTPKVKTISVIDRIKEYPGHNFTHSHNEKVIWCRGCKCQVGATQNDKLCPFWFFPSMFPSMIPSHTHVMHP